MTNMTAFVVDQLAGGFTVATLDYLIYHNTGKGPLLYHRRWKNQALVMLLMEAAAGETL